MKTIFRPILGLALGAALSLGASPAAAEELTIPLSRPGQPVVLGAAGLHATFTVEGYDGDVVLIETAPADEKAGHSHGSRDEDAPPGMRRLPNAGFGLEAEEEDNKVRVKLDGRATQRVRIRVPRNTSVHLKSVNGGKIEVRGVSGEHELEHTNGAITATDVSGSVVAQTTNGAVKVTFTRIDPGTPMSFVSFNGSVDVTFPPGLAADLKMRSHNGQVYTDFDVEVQESGAVKKEERKEGGYRVSLERAIEAKVGGGGPEMTLRTFNGSIYVRKGS